MKIPHPELAHATSLEQAERLQQQVQDMVQISPLRRQPHRVVGCDVAYSKDGAWGSSAALALNVETLIKIEHQTAHALCSFPYVPGLFAFRELPILFESLKQLTEIPDVVVVEGHGIAHPRHAGLACHFGVTTEIPTIGCAKSPLGGDWKQPEDRAGAWTEVRMDGNVVGAAFRSRMGSQPVFVSPGHLVDLPSAVNLMTKLCRGRRLPDPLARAHDAAVKVRDRRERQQQPV
jgi:deoxyribonuclease V